MPVSETSQRPLAPPPSAPDTGTSRLRPKDAATLIIIDRSSRRSPRVLMGRRSMKHRFMPGVFVFPGGRTESSDGRMPVAGVLHPRAEEALMARVTGASAQKGRMLALAAIRETYEETGLLLGTKAYGPPERVPAGSSWTAFRDNGVLPDLEGLQFIARAITPAGQVRRFDTRFFAVDRTAVAHEVEGILGPDAELSELDWMTFERANSLDLKNITGIMLGELEARIAAGFLHQLPVPFYHFRRGRRIRELL